MKIDFNPLVLFQFLVLVQGFTTGILLLSSTRQSRQNLWLGALIVAMSFQVLDSFCISTGIYRDHHTLYFSPFFYSWGYGALFYFYLQTLDNQHFKLNRHHLWYFAPLSMQALFYTFLVVQDLDFKTWFWFNVHKPYTRYLDYYGGIILTFFFLYLSYDIVQKTDKRLRRFLGALVIFYAVAAIDPLLNQWYLPPRSPKFYLVEYVLPLFTYWLGLMAYWRERNAQKTVEKTKNTRGEANPEQLKRIVEVLEKQRLYLNAELTLNDVAQAVGLNTAVVSHAVNAGLGLSFNDLVNQYRIEAVKLKFTEGVHRQQTLLAIAFDCGFNSKNTFNRAFRKSTGVSPKEYLETL